MTCRRNAFVVLCNVDQPLAVQYLLQVIDSVPTFDELLQLAVIELIRKDSKTSATNKVRQKWIGMINGIYFLLLKLFVQIGCLHPLLV